MVTWPDGQTLDIVYDSGGRPSTLTIPGPQTLTYGYEPTSGNLGSITAPDGTVSYGYDGSLLTTTTWAGAVAGSVGRTYDTNFRVSSQSVNGGNTISFGYDNDSLVTSAGSLLITRHPSHGLISDTTLGMISDTRTYNPFGELATYRVTHNASPITFLDTQFTRDKLGRITQKVETIGGVTDTFEYVYDQAGRLTEVKKNGAMIETHSYDANGNRETFIDSSVAPAVVIQGTYDDQDRLLTYGDLEYTYTANGELLTKSNPTIGQSGTFTYDVLGNLQGVSFHDGTVLEYVVDGHNRRVGKKVSGTLVQGFLYQDQLNPVAELDGAGVVVARFVYGTKANVPDYMIKGGVTYRIVSDHLGSVRLVVNTADGSIAQRIDYDAYGDIIQDTNPGFQPFAFAGGLYDQHTGLTRFGARDYEAQTGRWTAKDPIRFRGKAANLYSYVFNNPVNLVDPFGLWPFLLPGKDSALKNGPSWVDYYLPDLTDKQSQDVVQKVVKKLGWSDVFEAEDTFGEDFKPPKRDEVQNLTDEQKDFIRDLADRSGLSDDTKKMIEDLLDPPQDDKDLLQSCPVD